MNRVLNGIAAAVFALALAGCRHGNDGSYTVAAVYTVTFDSRGGSAVAAQTVLKGGKATQPVAPVRSGCLFADWYKNAAYAAAWNFGVDAVTAQTTLYAKWHVVSISIDPHPASVEQGRTQPFTAMLTAGDTALWSLDAPHHPGTHISADGELFVDAAETAATLTIRAVSKADSGWQDTATVKVGTVFDGSDYASPADALAALKAHIAATQGGWAPECPINLTLRNIPAEALVGSTDNYGNVESLGALYAAFGAKYVALDLSGYTDLAVISGVYAVTEAAEARKHLAGIILPEGLTSIGSYAFKETALASITFPAGLSSIGTNAFEKTKLTSLDLRGTGVTVINTQAFRDCASLKTVYLPEDLTAIERFGFGYCKELETIHFPSTLTSVDEAAFEEVTSLRRVVLNAAFTDDDLFKTLALQKDTTFTLTGTGSLHTNDDGKILLRDNGSVCTLLAYPSASGAVSISASGGKHHITALGDGVFKGDTEITSVSLPDTVTAVGAYAFNGCTSLESLTLPTGLTAIKNATFLNCTKLESLNLPAPTSLTSIGDNALRGTKLTALDLSSCTALTSVGSSAFSGCTALTEATLPDGLTAVGNYLFGGCTELAEVHLPSSVSAVGAQVFRNCAKLASIGLSSLKTIGNNAFESCTGITSVKLSSSVSTLSAYMFRYCTALSALYINKDSPPSGNAASLFERTPGISVTGGTLTIHVPVGKTDNYSEWANANGSYTNPTRIIVDDIEEA
jgi:hypothetical protein